MASRSSKKKKGKKTAGSGAAPARDPNLKVPATGKVRVTLKSLGDVKAAGVVLTRGEGLADLFKVAKNKLREIADELVDAEG